MSDLKKIHDLITLAVNELSNILGNSDFNEQLDSCMIHLMKAGTVILEPSKTKDTMEEKIKIYEDEFEKQLQKKRENYN